MMYITLWQENEAEGFELLGLMPLTAFAEINGIEGKALEVIVSDLNNVGEHIGGGGRVQGRRHIRHEQGHG